MMEMDGVMGDELVVESSKVRLGRALVALGKRRAHASRQPCSLCQGANHSAAEWCLSLTPEPD
jgi:hypothetical protein